MEYFSCENVCRPASGELFHYIISPSFTPVHCAHICLSSFHSFLSQFHSINKYMVNGESQRCQISSLGNILTNSMNCCTVKTFSFSTSRGKDMLGSNTGLSYLELEVSNVSCGLKTDTRREIFTLFCSLYSRSSFQLYFSVAFKGYIYIRIYV